MSLLPLPSARPAERPTERLDRAERPTRAERTERRSAAEPVEANERTERTTRSGEQSPPDFALLLALLGGTANRPERELVPALQLVPGGESPVAGSDETVGSGSALLDLDQRTLAREVRAEAMRTARSLVEPGPSATDRATGALMDNDALRALAERAQGARRGELLARNDQRAADVRAALDALLDVAGTPRGLSLVAANAAERGSAAREGTVRMTAERPGTERGGRAIGTAGIVSDVTVAVRDTESLAADFRLRLDRVIDRMRDEFGHDVQVVETVRSQERQEHLYAQGRTRPGPVVTWTTDSAHRTGEAADVIIDGKWNHPQGYARLHVIAAEEGLDTLGMRDPGHLELRGSAARRAVVASAGSAAAPTAADTTGGMARVAQVAAVASVAAVAQVAQVATVARPGAGRAVAAARGANLGEGAAVDVPSASSAMTVASGDATTAASAGARGSSTREGGRESERETPAERRRADLRTDARGDVRGESMLAGSLSASVDRVLDGGVPRVEAPVGSSAAARAEAIAVLREDAPARPISSLTMQLEGADGSDEIRVNLRGGAVGARVQTDDAALAERLRMQTADLQDALGRHGLDTEPLRVRQGARAQDGDTVRLSLGEHTDVLRTTGTTPGQQTGQGTTDHGARERPTARQQGDREARQARDERDEHHSQGRQQSRQENR